ASANITVKTVPNITQNITGDSVVCAGISSYSLPQITNVNYTWSISAGGTIQQLNSSVNVNWITPGTYTLTAIPSNNCGNGNAITKQITVRGTPSTPAAIQGLDTSCTVQGLYTVGLQTGVTYNWSLGSGGVITPQGNAAVTILWTNAGTHTITVTPQNICGTLGTPVTKTVTVLIPPQVNGDILGAVQVCNDETESYIITSNPVWTYNWTIDNGNLITINGNQATVDFNTIGTTTLSVAVENQCGIAPAKTLMINVEDNTPSLTGDILGDTLVCRNSDIIYSTINNSDFNYNWVLNGGGTVSPIQSSSIVVWQNAGTYNLGVAPSNFCGTGDTVLRL
ncbi:MAG: PKD domain-containing protein, partial [Saprospiraceae bacterium]|nr:PKD domain-containing protein [Saprospiraceae bacterium]